MNLYANGFRCAMREDGNEFVIQFIQETPTYNGENEISGVDAEVISSIVMTPKSASSLAAVIHDCIHAQPPQLRQMTSRPVDYTPGFICRKPPRRYQHRDGYEGRICVNHSAL